MLRMVLSPTEPTRALPRSKVPLNSVDDGDPSARGTEVKTAVITKFSLTSERSFYTF